MIKQSTNKAAFAIIRFALFCAVLLLALTSFLPFASFAQETKEEQRKLASEKELNEIQEKIQISISKKSELEEEIETLETDRASINRNLIETSTRSRSLETSINRAANRLDELRAGENAVRTVLREKRSVLIEVIAALQRMGHKPPPALLVRPEDALSSVRSAILLGAVVPEVRDETKALITQLQKLVDIKKSIDVNRSTLKSDLQKLAEEETRLTFLLEQKKKLSITARQELTTQTALAAELAGKATNLNGLIKELEKEVAAAKQAAIFAKEDEEKRKKLELENVAKNNTNSKQPDFSDTGRISPAIAFSSAKGLLPKPVSGVEIASFGKKNIDGEISQGIAMATRSNARVNSPADGWIIYAGPFRSYGKLLILNAGDGYHVVISGMETLNVELGQFILTGEPVGTMSENRIASSQDVEVGLSKPILYIEFRKDGKSIDPSPWWVNSGEKESNG
ncbi:MAG: murein hydrolase activator EnvC [Nitratireductor sp.]